MPASQCCWRFLPTANTLAWSGPNQGPSYKLNFQLIAGHLPIGAGTVKRILRLSTGRNQWETLPGRYGPEGLLVSVGSASCLNTGDILREALPYMSRCSLLCR